MLTAYTVKQLAGGEFQLRNSGGGSGGGALVTIRFPKPFPKGWPRGGAEGYAVPATMSSPALGDVPCIVKAFRNGLPGRGDRMDKLVGHGLARSHDWLFSGVPFASVRRATVNGVPLDDSNISIHVCYDVNGEDFAHLKNHDAFDAFDADERGWLAAQLCETVAGLEKRRIVHGDLSHGNIMIGWDDERRRVECVLIDYDGFTAAGTPPLPRRHAGQPIRMLGSPGYQHPELMRRSSADPAGADEGVFVENDRFALGVLCCELMVWRSSVRQALLRDELLSPEALATGRDVIPKELSRGWPDGADLLAEALRAPTAADLPEPHAWLRAMGRRVDDHAPAEWTTPKPVMRISRQSGGPHSPISVRRRVEFGHSAQGAGDLSAIDPRLAPVGFAYERADGALTLKLTFDWPELVTVTRSDRMLRLDARKAPRPRPLTFEVGPTDVIRSDGWRFDFSP
ncbi:serine/threonine-protein kinase [Rubrimonas cliftonensis]|uniref:Protein kinase domain-containing protein n=1 Tax=Rubrimonas cliftonensis TaxID=89524 RepID=A0A1H3VGJ9_9RHOB|nr:serine/threonine-protein kinase [Rubrimonas cliftonensis]SDZ73344.1 hypothetical protein SAMN05444370_10138 [Rubrimonas cliftonensis]